MPKVEAVSRERHMQTSWRQPSDFTFAAKEAVLPLYGTELRSATLAMPLAFAKHGDRFVLVAVTSPIQGQNLFVGPTGEWLGAYKPVILQAYPFQLLRASGSDKLVMCVDEEAVLPDDAGTERFYNEDGVPAPSVQQRMELLQRHESSRTITDLATAALAEAGVIKDWPIRVQIRDTSKPVAGLYRIDETALNALDESTFLKLRAASALPIAYAQLFSMPRIRLFERLIKFRRRLEKTGEKEKRSILEGLGLASDEDDTIKFN